LRWSAISGSSVSSSDQLLIAASAASMSCATNDQAREIDQPQVQPLGRYFERGCFVGRLYGGEEQRPRGPPLDELPANRLCPGPRGRGFLTQNKSLSDP